MEEYNVPSPLTFNPLKHHLPYIRDFVNLNIRLTAEREWNSSEVRKMLKHLGTSVMDVYNGPLHLSRIFAEILDYLEARKLLSGNSFASWAGTGFSSFRIISLTDKSDWILKYNDNEKRYVHIFPAKKSPHTFRIKSNTLKSAILYLIMEGKDYVTRDDLNRARAITGLPPVKNVEETRAVMEMIDILRI